MIKYLLGLLLNLFNPAVSLFALIDNKSEVSSRAKVYRKAKIFDSMIGAYTYVCPEASIVCADIGKFCSIAGRATIGLGIHELSYLSTSSIFTSAHNATGHQWTNQDSIEEFKRITIGNDVWIGYNSMIMGGVKIGDGAVIGAGAIVTKDVPAYAVVAGIPAKIIKYRFNESIIDALAESEWWNLPETQLKKSIKAFNTREITLEKVFSI